MMELYPYQQRVKELIQSGKSVILQAPTGAGKTRAALAPFIENFFDHADGSTPRKCIYSVPMRVLANQFYVEYEKLKNDYKKFKRNELSVTIQTGEFSNDPEFAGDLIFCTIDQFLSSYLTMPYSLPRRMANFNAGAFVGSYLVFDEFHLLDPDSTLPSTLYAIKRLHKVAPVLLMTATFSETLLHALKGELDEISTGDEEKVEIVLVETNEARSIETSFGQKYARQRMWATAQEPLSARAVLEKHNKRSLAICNTVQRAQTLYREIKDALEKETPKRNIEVILLHSRFLQKDRHEIEEKAKRLFGRSNLEGRVILVATQVIEVGVDITSEILHTELAPASSLIQRAGRCARYAGENGQVIVYPVEKKSPYHGKSWEREMDEAWVWLTNHPEVYDFGKEQAFVNAVATSRDKEILQNISDGRATWANDIHSVFLGKDDAIAASKLVRDVDSKLVLIHPNPQEELTLNPYLAEGFNIQTQTLRGMVKEWLKSDAEWCVKMLSEDARDKLENNRAEYAWKPLMDEKLISATRAVVVNPKLAGYLKDEGFTADKGDTGFVSTMSVMDAQQKVKSGYSYKLESYERHIELVLQAFQEFSTKELLYSAEALERAAGWVEGSVMRAAWLACFFHDVGKLSKGWQNWARAYQKAIDNPVMDNFSPGHTDYEWHNPWHKESERSVSKQHPRPPHAAESAHATARLIADILSEKDLAKAVITSIARHHSPFTNDCGSFVLEEQANRHIEETLKYIPENIRQQIKFHLFINESKSKQNGFSNMLITPDKTLCWMAYTLIVRALRHSDQEGTARGTY
jgi:CRISPR-associated endonuclease/helicase Cas3